MDYARRTPSRLPYLRLLKWLGPPLIFLLTYQFELNYVRHQYAITTSEVITEVQRRVDSVEVALESFANFLAVDDQVTEQEVRAYVRGIRNLYPGFYMFEIASRIEHADRQQFEAGMRAKGYKNFKIHSFDYDDTRTIQPVGQNQIYYPIHFIEPETPETVDVLGLDLASTANMLTEPLLESLETEHPLASKPFELLEGGKGYVVYRPVRSLSDELLNARSFAMLIVRANDLMPAVVTDNDLFEVTLTYRQSQPVQHEEPLLPIDKSQALPQVFLTGLFPPYSRVVELDSRSQPFQLGVTRHFSWQDMSLLRFSILLALGLILLRGLLRLLIRRHLQHALISEEKERLYRQANFDHLTRLPNINLFYDRAEQAVEVARRYGHKVIFSYLDLDQFKFINDNWGHDAGDKLLEQVATRLNKTLRQCDTAARIHGDEFLILCPEMDSVADRHQLACRIKSVFEDPFVIDGEPMSIRCSVGTAVYPDDGSELDQLLQVSDSRMYMDKKKEFSSRVGERELSPVLITDQGNG